MSSLSNKLRSLMNPKPVKKTEPEPTPEEREAVDFKRASELLINLATAPPPPGYAKALCKAHRRFLQFVNLMGAVREYPAPVARLLAHEMTLRALRDDFAEAATLATKTKEFPIVCVPSGLYEEILGTEHQKPADGEHWPLPQREGPITWED